MSRVVLGCVGRSWAGARLRKKNKNRKQRWASRNGRAKSPIRLEKRRKITLGILDAKFG
jgi:hypothetical protein